MKTILIINEKPSQARKFSHFLGGTDKYEGQTYSYNGNNYQIVAAHGHLLKFTDPQDMTNDVAQKERLKSWDNVDYMPWDLRTLTWKMKPTDLTTLNKIKHAAQGKDIIIIASDNDPSGEGDLLGWEIVNWLRFPNEVWRARFKTDSKEDVLKALNNPERASIATEYQQPRYLKAVTRSRFDYASGLQLTRLTTKGGRNGGFTFKKSLQVGRLKALITRLVWLQNLAIKNYVKKPYYEVRYKDSSGNVFKRDYADNDDWRFTAQDQALQDQAKYKTDQVVIESTETKTQTPPQLVNLAKIASVVTGFKKKKILDTYQTMYEDDVVSYPRTTDKKISQDDFDKLLPYVDQIADVIGVDKKLLTHRTSRKKFIVKSDDHGANRPNEKNVPKSLADIEAKYGKCGVQIYQIVARSYLAMLCEDYEYVQQKAHLASHPDFKVTINTPSKLNFKLVLKDNNESTKIDDKKLIANNVANSFIYQGQNTPPTKPTFNFIRHFLEKNDIGTGATQVQTISDISEGELPQIKDVKGSYTLTDRGILIAKLTDHTWIASSQITRRLQDLMEEVEKGTKKYGQVLGLVTKVVEHDKAIILKNALTLKEDPEVLAIAGDLIYQEKPKFSGIFKPTGEQGNFTIEIYDGHQSTEEEQQKALNGEVIEYQMLNKVGHEETHYAKIIHKKGEEKDYFGWLVSFPHYEFTFIDGKKYKIAKERSGHKWTQEEVQELAAGKTVKCTDLIGKNGTYSALLTFNPNAKYKFDMEFINKDGSRIEKAEIHYKKKIYKVNKDYFGHTWTQSELDELGLGNTIVVPLKAKSGKIYNWKITFSPRTKYLFKREFAK